MQADGAAISASLFPVQKHFGSARLGLHCSPASLRQVRLDKSDDHIDVCRVRLLARGAAGATAVPGRSIRVRRPGHLETEVNPQLAVLVRHVWWRGQGRETGTGCTP